MALLHKATLRPTKLELLGGWLPSQDWYRGTADVVRVASFRFDDPAGAVGIETMLVRSGGPVDAGAPVDAGGPIYQAPLTYRGAPLDGGDGWLIGTTEHSVLGRRWVYDACGDPVYAATLASAILGGGGQAEEFFEVDGRLERREPSMTIVSTGGRHGEAPVVDRVRRVVDGDPTIVVTDAVELAVARRLDEGRMTGFALLTGAWPGQPTPVPLASATPLTT